MLKSLNLYEQIQLREQMELEKAYIFYGNLRLRADRSLTIVETGEQGWKAAGSYLKGMPFHAFTFHLLEGEGTYSIEPMLAYFRKELGGDDGSNRQGVITAAESYVERLEISHEYERRTMLLMKLMNGEHLLPRGASFLIEGSKGEEAERLALEIGMLSFRAEEVRAMPHIALDSEEGILMAMAGFHVYENDFVEIGNVGTAAEYRKKGLGMQITSDICRFALQKSPNVYLCVFVDNAAAIRVYEKLGFTTVERQTFVTFQW